MNSTETRRLLRLVRAISDHEPVDWGAEPAGDARAAHLLDTLKLLQTIEAVHRDAAGQGPAGEAAPEPPEGGAAIRDARSGADAGTPIPSTWGPLRILARMGAGTHGEVFLARDEALGRTVALKLRHVDPRLRSSDVDRFLHEARRLACVRQRNCLVVHGADLHEGRAGFWTDRIEGDTLEELLQRIGPMGAEEAALVGTQLCRALAAVHECNLVHGDVKTPNVMRERGGRIVLLDFGSVREPEALDAEWVGTPLYMAPEDLRNGTVSRASDLYALGVLLYRLVSCRFPVEASSLLELQRMHEAREHTSLSDLRPDLPAAFVRVIERAIDPDPARRPSSAGAMEHSLAVALGSLTPSEIARVRIVPAPPAAPAVRQPVPGPRRPFPEARVLVWMAAGALLALLAMWVAVRLSQ